MRENFLKKLHCKNYTTKITPQGPSVFPPCMETLRGMEGGVIGIYEYKFLLYKYKFLLWRGRNVVSVRR